MHSRVDGLHVQDRALAFSIRDLTKEYHMGEVSVSALRGVNLEIYDGEFAVILGPSGCGKSTLLNILGGLDDATSGEVRHGSEVLSRYNDKELTLFRRNNIGFIFQFYNLMPNLTAKENVEMATEISKDPMDALEALERVHLQDRADHFPAQLSGGEQQRVAIARAIAKRPKILLCDEPTGALDITTGKIVLDVLNDVNESMGTTLLVITHNASIGQMADRVFRMKDGNVRDIQVNAKRMVSDDIDW